MKVDNAIILAAGASSRFAPLSYEKHKALIQVKGEILIERQIKQLIDVGINDIYVVTGYKSEQFAYLEARFGVKLVHNNEFATRNNNSSIFKVRDIIKNSYICSADNYFAINPFSNEEASAYYSCVYSDDYTKEWCVHTNQDGYIDEVSVGGNKSWYMLGHVFWDEKFSRTFIEILENCYDNSETEDKLWEDIFIENLDKLNMKIKKYSDKEIFEFDTLDELRAFDTSYIEDSHSAIIKELACKFNAKESELTDFKAIKSNDNMAIGFEFKCRKEPHIYKYDEYHL